MSLVLCLINSRQSINIGGMNKQREGGTGCQESHRKWHLSQLCRGDMRKAQSGGDASLRLKEFHYLEEVVGRHDKQKE